MSIPPIPVVFEPRFKAKPWGGRRLATLLGKNLPPNEPIGESWELVSLPGNESRVRDGPLAGRTLGDLVALWGRDLLGDAELVDGRFPLLIKFLDARENLSVQVHPKPLADDPAGEQPAVKHEAWYVVHADPGARLYIGLKPGVGPADVARVANTPGIVDILQSWEAHAGQCYYLPSGTLHALGAGLVVAEIQTPSDVTYRVYDWDRVGLDGQPRALHIEPALANIRFDADSSTLLQARAPTRALVGGAVRAVCCERFVVDVIEGRAGHTTAVSPGSMRIWLALAGAGRLWCGRDECGFATGDCALLPAHSVNLCFELTEDSRWLDVTIPELVGRP